MIRPAETAIYLGLSGYFTAAQMVGYRIGPVRWIALGGFLLVGGTTALQMRRGRASPVDKYISVYLLFCLAGFLVWPQSLGRLLAAYPLPLLYGVFLLGLILTPLVGGDLFTLFWARRWTDPAVWDTDIFKTVNRRMTLAWGGLFALCGLVGLIPELSPALDGALWRLLLGLGGPLLILAGVGAPFNKWYPDHHLRGLGLDPDINRPGAGPVEDRPGAREFSGSEKPKPAVPKEDKMSAKPLVVAVNGSPRPDISNTGLLIEMFRSTLSQEGFDLEVINLAEKKINYCLGDGWCLDKGQCWQRDDQKAIMGRILEADAVILGSPVYFMNVTAQMKTFLDRCLPLGHKPREFWKPGLAVSVSAGLAETEVVNYLAGCLRVFGAFSLGTLTAIGSGGPAQLYGLEHAETRASDLALDLVRAVREKRRLPATDMDLRFFQFMGGLIKRSHEFMRHDYDHWQQLGIMDDFKKYAQQEMSSGSMMDPQLRQAWFKELIAKHQGGETEMRPESDGLKEAADAKTCKQLIEIMPLGFQPTAAGDLKALIQFEISGDEDFTAHLAIAEGKAVHHDGPAENPDLTVKAPAKIWLGVSQGKINGQMAFMTGKFKAKGDLGLLMKLNSLFKG